MSKWSAVLEPRGDKPQRLDRVDWAFVGFAFALGWYVCYLVLPFAPHIMPGQVVVVGLALLFAFAAAGGCAYLWQYDTFSNNNMVLLGYLLITLVLGAWAAIAGLHSGNEGGFALLIHGAPQGKDWSFNPNFYFYLAGFGFYVSIVTIVRKFVRSSLRRRRVGHLG